jgi:hypothetical protein
LIHYNQNGSLLAESISYRRRAELMTATIKVNPAVLASPLLAAFFTTVFVGTDAWLVEVAAKYVCQGAGCGKAFGFKPAIAQVESA